MTIPSVKLRPHHDERVKAGHPWVFSNEIADDVKTLPLGGAVDVFDAKGAFVGRGYANPRSLIAVRLLTRRRKEDIDDPIFFVGRLRDALAYRTSIYPDRRSFRVIHAEGDGLPGLVIDRFEDVVSVQITTLGMEARKAQIEQAIRDVLAPTGAVLRGDARMRDLEGLGEDQGVWFGQVPDEVVIDEFGVKYGVNPLGSQKTGHFFDQAENRRYAGSLTKGRSVLDVYCNTGGFGLHCLAQGAKSVMSVDSAAENIVRAQQNAELNGFGDKLEGVCAEGRTTLEALVAAGKRFGAVVLDPPAFAKTRKVAARALVGYRDINSLGMMLCEEGGLLFTSSCSYHVQEDRFVDSIREAAQRAGKRIRMVRRGEQASDHPVNPAIAESRYLKSYAFWVAS